MEEEREGKRRKKNEGQSGKDKVGEEEMFKMDGFGMS